MPMCIKLHEQMFPIVPRRWYILPAGSYVCFMLCLKFTALFDSLPGDLPVIYSHRTLIWQRNTKRLRFIVYSITVTLRAIADTTQKKEEK